MVVYRLPLFKGSSGNKYSVMSRLNVQFSSFMRKQLKWASVVYVPRLWYSMIPVAKAFKKLTIVHLHDYTPICPLCLLYDPSKRMVCRNRWVCSARCIYQFERDMRRDLGHSVLSLLLNLFARVPLGKCVEQADAVVCVSEAQRKILIEHMPLIRDKSRVIYNPLPNVSPVDIDGGDFGYLGGFNPLKGFEVLCKALSLIKDHPFKVQVTGESIPREIVCDNAGGGFLSRIGIVLHERLKQSDQEVFYKQIKGVVFPSIVEEPLPYVTAEAILRGRLLIASKVGGVPEQVRGCKGVFLFEAGNYRELAETLDFAKNLDTETVLELGYHDREVFRRTFNNEKTIEEFKKMIVSLS